MQGYNSARVIICQDSDNASPICSKDLCGYRSPLCRVFNASYSICENRKHLFWLFISKIINVDPQLPDKFNSALVPLQSIEGKFRSTGKELNEGVELYAFLFC